MFGITPAVQSERVRTIHAITMNANINVRDWCHINAFVSSFRYMPDICTLISGLRSHESTSIHKPNRHSTCQSAPDTQTNNAHATLTKSPSSIADMHELHTWHTYSDVELDWHTVWQFFFCVQYKRLFRIQAYWATPFLFTLIYSFAAIEHISVDVWRCLFFFMFFFPY